MCSEEEFWQRVYTELYDGICVQDGEQRIAHWNRGAERITGFSSEEVIGRACPSVDFEHTDGRGVVLCEKNCPLKEALETGEPILRDLFCRQKGGSVIPISMSLTPVRDSHGKPVVVQVFREAYDREACRQEVKRLRREALIDELTKLSNRRYVRMKLSENINLLHRHGIRFGVIFVDLDYLKEINDAYGHPTGDRVLGMIARTIRANLRASDTAGRWGGDEFIVLLPACSLEMLKAVAEKIRLLIKNSTLAVEGDGRIQISASIGATLSKQDDSIEEILRRVDSLCYLSKAHGRNKVSFG